MTYLLGRWTQFSLVVAAVAVFWLFPIPAGAVVGIGVTPTQVSVEIDPGGSASGVITVSNEGDVPLSVRAYAMERRKDESGLRFLDPGDPRISAARWLVMKPETFWLSPRTAQEVRWEVRAPPSAPPGDHVAMAFFEYAPPSPSDGGSKMVIGGRVGTILAVRVPGQVVEAARIVSFGLERRTVVWRFPQILGWKMKPVVWQLPWVPVANNPPVPVFAHVICRRVDRSGWRWKGTRR
ncbi:hypothetical protein [Caldinitratiruptor microaerophilus]|uniref:Uncharacterized protein n=1 Tax=Caldinitratiruptor microaerophilus TaxID=671077 RepID=A0AA35G5X5_9FIRM|nr:hypothetical protein [Caldinitratiruptor microaerophilus]BDG60316.1 hypothetical protein caldi_14060 [Caldinitratiruptor microaerophilus]